MDATSKPDAAKAGTGSPDTRGAVYAVVLLTAMNLLNFIDRYVPAAVKDLFKKDLELSDAQTSLPFSAFIIVFMIASPIAGSLAERGGRKVLVAVGVAVWSLATAAGSLATGFVSFLIARAMVGIGEAVYTAVMPTLISDFYPPLRRNRILSVIYSAIPVGAAMGFLLGGALGARYGWRSAFWMCGLPGLVVAGLVLFMREPPRGQFDGPTGQGSSGASAPPLSWPEVLRALSKNRTYLITLAGYTFVTGALGAIADWAPTYFARVRGMTIVEANGIVGPATVIGGLVGTMLGSVIADRIRHKTKNAYLATAGLSMIPAAILCALVLFVPADRTVTLVGLVVCEIFLWCHYGPVSAVFLNSVDPRMRARAFGLTLLVSHLLGDVTSPPLIGFISDTTGSLPLGVTLVPVLLLLGGLAWLFGWRSLREPASVDRP